MGGACLIALLDIRNQNPCSRILTSKYKTLDKVRQSVLEEIKNKREYRDQSTTGRKYKNFQGLNPEFPVQVSSINSNSRMSQNCHNAVRSHASTCDKMIWRSYADGQLKRESNDDNDSNRSYDEIGFSNNHDKSFDDSYYNNCNDNKNDNNNNNDNNNEDMHKNDKNKDDENRRKPHMKKSVNRGEASSNKYDSTHTRNNVALESTRRVLLTPRMTAAALTAANALKCSRRIDVRHSSSSSSSWPGTRSTTIEVAGNIRAGSVGCAVNMRHHGIDVRTSSYTGNHPSTIPNNVVKRIEVSSLYDKVCPKIKLGQHDVIHNKNNNKNNYKNNKDSNKDVREISFTKLELLNDMKTSSTILTPTTNKFKKLSRISKKETGKKKSDEKNVILSFNKSASEKDIDGDLNDLIRDSLKIDLTGVTLQSPIFITRQPQKVKIDTENNVKTLHNICTHILKKKKLLLSERLLTENFSAHNTSLSKKLILSSNQILRNNPVKITGNNIDAVILMRNKNVVEGQKFPQNSLVAKNNPFKSCSRAKMKGFDIEGKSILSSPESNQLLDESTSGRKVMITEIQNNLNSSEGTHLKSVTIKSHLNGTLDKRIRRKSYSTVENLRNTSMIERNVN